MSATEYVAIAVIIALALAVIVFAAAKINESRNPPVGQFMTVSGVRLHYLVRGTGEPIVLIHGNMTMIEDYITSGLIERLAKRAGRTFVDAEFGLVLWDPVQRVPRPITAEERASLVRAEEGSE